MDERFPAVEKYPAGARTPFADASPVPQHGRGVCCSVRVGDEHDVGETIATTTNRARSITMGNQDMRKARSRVDFGTGK